MSEPTFSFAPEGLLLNARVIRAQYAYMYCACGCRVDRHTVLAAAPRCTGCACPWLRVQARARDNGGGRP